jgi:hypothetical protein
MSDINVGGVGGVGGVGVMSESQSENNKLETISR